MVLCADWITLHGAFPHVARLRRRCGQFFEPDSDALGDKALLTVLQNSMDMLRSLAPRPGCGRDDERRRVAEQVQALQYTKLCFEAQGLKDVCTGKYSFHTLLTCVVQANLLKCQAKLRQAIVNGLRLTVPTILLKDALQRLDATEFPSKTTIGSARFCLDMAFALLMRSRLGVNDQQVTFLWVDSSPQGGVFVNFVFFNTITASGLP